MPKETNKPKTKPKYSVKVALNGETYTCETDDIAEALLGLEVRAIKTKIVITVSANKEEVSRILWGVQARRTLKNRITARVFARNVERLLNN